MLGEMTGSGLVCATGMINFFFLCKYQNDLSFRRMKSSKPPS